MRLSPNFALEEFTCSQIAVRNCIDNTPNEEQIENLRELCVYVLEPLRKYLKARCRVSSGYRAPQVNKLAGGSPTSDHQDGKAADVTFEGFTPAEVFTAIRELKLPVKQCIEEFGAWVHVSYDKDNIKREFLLARKENGKTNYIKVA